MLPKHLDFYQHDVMKNCEFELLWTLEDFRSEIRKKPLNKDPKDSYINAAEFVLGTHDEIRIRLVMNTSWYATNPYHRDWATNFYIFLRVDEPGIVIPKIQIGLLDNFSFIGRMKSYPSAVFLNPRDESTCLPFKDWFSIKKLLLPNQNFVTPVGNLRVVVKGVLEYSRLCIHALTSVNETVEFIERTGGAFKRGLYRDNVEGVISPVKKIIRGEQIGDIYVLPPFDEDSPENKQNI